MAKLSLRPLDDRIVVQPEAAETTTAGGIVLPDSAQEKPLRGQVVAVGPGKLMDSGNRGELSVDVGDTCLLYTSPSPRDQRGSRMPSSA